MQFLAAAISVKQSLRADLVGNVVLARVVLLELHYLKYLARIPSILKLHSRVALDKRCVSNLVDRRFLREHGIVPLVGRILTVSDQDKVIVIPVGFGL